MNEEIYVERIVWVRLETDYCFFNEYKLKYKSDSKVPNKNIYIFKLTDIEKLNERPFTGGGGNIINWLPRIGHTVQLRQHKKKWNIKNMNWAGRAIQWFNVERLDDLYKEVPVRLYDI